MITVINEYHLYGGNAWNRKKKKDIRRHTNKQLKYTTGIGLNAHNSHAACGENTPSGLDVHVAARAGSVRRNRVR